MNKDLIQKKEQIFNSTSTIATSATDRFHNTPLMQMKKAEHDRIFGHKDMDMGSDRSRPVTMCHPTIPTLQRKANMTGLPDNLKTGVENLSGISMDNVKVHYNSSKPAQLQAHAYTQGTDIHVVPAQEKHLPHEAWHVVQQAQGRVAPTMQMKGVNVNDDAGLEREATVMGERAVQLKAEKNNNCKPYSQTKQIIQGQFWERRGNNYIWHDEQVDVANYRRVNNETRRYWLFTYPVYEINYQNGDLFYGLTQPRGITLARFNNGNRKTIDEYNRDIGIDWANMNTMNAATTIFRIRVALNDQNPINNWAGNLGLPQIQNTINNDQDLQAWINLLVQNRREIGLHDLQSRGKGLNRLNTKNRFEKNLNNNYMDQYTQNQNRINSNIIHNWLRRDLQYAQLHENDINYPRIGDWISKEFFRRTSKLGIDFIIDRNHRVHFNLKANVGNLLNQDNGIATISNSLPNQVNQENRPITLSEYRHIKKRIKNNNLNRADVNFYNE